MKSYCWLLVGSMLVGVGAAHAQMADTQPPPMPVQTEPMLPLPFRAPQEPRNHLSVGFGLTGGVSSSIFGVGKMSAPALPDINQPGTLYNYSDGYVNPDSEWNPSAEVPVTDTSNFSYNYASQRAVDGNGDNVLHYHVYGSGTAQDIGGQDTGTGLTWELKYERDLGRLGRARWGLFGGFSFNGSDSNRNEQLTGDLLVVRDSFNFGANPIPQGEDGGPYQSPVFVRPIPTDDDPDVVAIVAPLAPVLREDGIVRPGEAIVNGNYELSAAFYHFRIGPTVMLPIGQRFGLTASAGVAATVAAARFTAVEDLVDSEDTVLTNASGTGSSRDIAVGAYAETKAFYRINRGLSVYTGLNYVGTSANFETRIDDDKYATIDVSSSFSVTAGFRFSF